MTKTAVYSCPFIPAEWIAAHGLAPKRVLPRPRGGPAVMGEGICPYARAFANGALEQGAGHVLLFTTVCDQMRRVAEVVEGLSENPVFLMHVPATWQSVTAHKIYRRELHRLGRFLVRLGGRAPSDEGLARVMKEYDGARGQLRDARSRLTPHQFALAIARFHETGEVNAPPREPLPAMKGVPVALLGGPLLKAHFELYDLLEKAGGWVVLDGTTTGERALPKPFDRRRIEEDPFTTLAEAYFGAIPDAFQRPNSLLYSWLKTRLSERGVRGILFNRYTWCDTWHGEVQRMREWSGLPLLAIDCGDEGPLQQHTASRVEAFLEVLK